MNQTDIFQLRGLLQQARSILITIPQSKDIDVVGSALGLYLVLTKLGKKVHVVSPEKTKVGMAHFFAIDKIGSSISGENNLIISFPYQEGTIEKVSYNIENGKFNLVVEPRVGQLNFNPQQVEYVNGTGDFDMIWSIGAADLSALGTVYSQNQAVFTQKPIVNLDKSEDNARFGKLNFITRFTISQFIALLLKALHVPIDQDAASNILTGIVGENGNLSLDSADADMLESIAYLLRAKAQVLKSKNVTPTATEKPLNQSTPLDNTKISSVGTKDTKKTEEQTPDDWFKPKIYTTNKSTTLV